MQALRRRHHELRARLIGGNVRVPPTLIVHRDALDRPRPQVTDHVVAARCLLVQDRLEELHEREQSSAVVTLLLRGDPLEVVVVHVASFSGDRRFRKQPHALVQ